MKLEESNQEKAINFLNEKWPETGRACPICGNDKFVVSDTLFAITEYDPPTLGSVEFPIITFVCDNCGNVILFNAIKMGIIKGDG
jgi:predicted RNA-binding Zn-ribbon protein involved in translation (DUF1610 family)